MEHEVWWEKEFGAEPVLLLEPTEARKADKHAAVRARLKALGVPEAVIEDQVAQTPAVSREDAEEYARIYRVAAGGKTTIRPIAEIPDPTPAP